MSLQTVIDLEMTRTEGSKNVLKTLHEYNSISPDVVTRGWTQVVNRLQQISDPAHLSREHRQLQLQYTVGENIIFILLKNIWLSCERHEEWLYFVLMYFMYFTSGLRKVISVNCAMWTMQKCLRFSMHFAYFDQLRQFWVRNPQRIHATAAEERGRWRETGDGKLVFRLRVQILQNNNQLAAVSLSDTQTRWENICRSN